MTRTTLYTILGVFAFGCMGCQDDFLSQKPVGAYGIANVATRAGIQQALIGAYSQLNGTRDWAAYGMATPGMAMAEMMGGNAHKGSTLTDQAWMNFMVRYEVNTNSSGNNFRYLYNAVFLCNTVLTILPQVTELSTEEAATIAAEARFLRGHYYFLLKRWYKHIPWIESTTEFRVPNTDESGNYVNIWPQIQADFEFARKNLPQTQSDLGRPNRWAAEAYYAKVLIYRASEGDLPNGFNDALQVLNDVMANGVTSKGEKYQLEENFHYNFDVTRENGPESVFAVQHSANDGTNSIDNGNQEIRGASGKNPQSPGWGRGSGFYTPSQWFVDHFRVDGNGLPYLDMYETNPNSVKNDDGLRSSDPFEPETAPLDPRLDWSVGRRGIPFLDFGINPGADWVYTPIESGPYIQKKGHIRNDQDGIYVMPGQAYNALNVNIIRYADVILYAAEMEARVGNLEKAREYVNKIRNRMAQNSESPDHWVQNMDGTGAAANYSIATYPTGHPAFANQDAALRTILFERNLELGLEGGHRFFDLIRFGLDEELLNEYIQHESPKRSIIQGAAYSRTPDMILPIPQTVIDNSMVDGVPTLKQNPGY